MIDLEVLKFRNNGITDDGAALLLKACSMCPKFRAFHLEKNEINHEFAEVLKNVLSAT